MEKNHSRGGHNKPTGIPPSPRLIRCRSGNQLAMSLPEIHTNTSSSSLTSVQRSKSTSRSRTNKPSTKDKFDNGFVKSLRPKSTSSTSPSAWALSPGRSSTYSSPLPKSPSPSGRVLKEAKIGGGGVGGVLKYFRQRKESLVQEEEFRRFRVLHNRLLQWRFVNAQGDASMAAMKAFAEKKLFNVWVKVFILRNSILEKKIQVQRYKKEIKLYDIVNPQICLLKEWAKLASKNSEAVDRLVRKLSAMSIRLPLVQDAKANVASVSDALSTTMDVIYSIEATITKFQYQVEKTCYLLTELVIMVKQHEEYMVELEMMIAIVAALEAEERGLRLQLIQVASELSSAKGGLTRLVN